MQSLEDTFADILQKARLGCGLSIQQLADQCHLAALSVVQWEGERAKPSREETAHVARALRLDPHRLSAIALDEWRPMAWTPSASDGVLRIEGFVGTYGVNGYVAFCPSTKEAVIIDTANDPHRLLEEVGRHELQVRGIFLTHLHADHLGGLEILRPVWDVPLYLHPAASDGMAGRWDAKRVRWLDDGQLIPVGQRMMQAVYTPGHTVEGVTYLVDRFAFVGDTLFAGSVGRANPPQYHGTLLLSIRTRLWTLPDETRLLPGHGPSTTVGEEKAHNPFFPEVAAP